MAPEQHSIYQGLIAVSDKLNGKVALAAGGSSGINVSGIAPTVNRTDPARHYLEDEAFYGALVSRIPLTRVGEPNGFVGITDFCASQASNFVIGQILFINGGVTAAHCGIPSFAAIPQWCYKQHIRVSRERPLNCALGIP